MCHIIPNHRSETVVRRARARPAAPPVRLPGALLERDAAVGRARGALRGVARGRGTSGPGGSLHHEEFADEREAAPRAPSSNLSPYNGAGALSTAMAHQGWRERAEFGGVPTLTFESLGYVDVFVGFCHSNDATHASG